MIAAPRGYRAYFDKANGQHLVREVVAFDDGGGAQVVDEVGARLVSVNQLGDGWRFQRLAFEPQPRALRFEVVVTELEDEPSSDAEPRWCEARPPEPDVYCDEGDDDD